MLAEDLAARIELDPFPHANVPEALSPEQATRYVRWLRESAPWELTNAEFYDQYEFSLLDVQLPSSVEELASEPTLRQLRLLMGEWFGAHLSERVDVTAHKLVPGQTIKIHNDYIPGAETHRLLVQLSEDWVPDNGGYLMLFSGHEPETVRHVLEPRAGSVQAFEISVRSHHAVSKVHAGDRYTLVYSFFAASPA